MERQRRLVWEGKPQLLPRAPHRPQKLQDPNLARFSQDNIQLPEVGKERPSSRLGSDK
jgi:hypothetical protein